MKHLLAALLLCLCLNAHAQGPETLHSSQRYGWFQTEQWARDLILGAPGWRIQSRDTDAGGWQYLLFVSESISKGVTYKFWKGRLGGITYSFFNNVPEGREWRTGEMQRVGPNEWVQPADNARIKREYDGQLIVYNVVYEPLSKD